MTSRVLRLVSSALVLTALSACQDQSPQIDTADTTTIASDPVANTSSVQAGMSAARPSLVAAVGTTYLSLQAGRFPGAALAVIEHRTSGTTITRPMTDGGLDPVAIQADVGDRLEMQVIGANNAVLASLDGKVPDSRKPRVVRTLPPRKKTDVPLNPIIVVVFSEPIRENTIQHIQLTRAGVRVGGTFVLSADGLRAQLQPDQLLAPNTEYVIVVPTGVSDLSGDPLEEAVAVEFTTGTTTAIASVTTEEPALILNPFNNEMRTFDAEAIQDASGKFSGNFRIFYAAKGWLVKGRVTCFAIVDGKAWVAGIVEEASHQPEAVGTSQGWRAEDNGPPGESAPDRLSLSHDLESDGTAAARQDFCANKPLVDPSGEEITLYDLLSGNIVVAGATKEGASEPEPPEVSTGLLAYFGDAGIYITNPAGQFPTRILEREIPGGHRGLGLSWSPDGARIAFATPLHRSGAPGEPSTGVFIVNSDGTGLMQLTRPGGIADDIQPAWSPDGRQIAFVRFGENGNLLDPTLPLYLIGSDGSGLKLLTSDGERPAWSPDSKRIAFTRRDGIYVINSDGSGIRRLTAANGDEAAWSPDGTKIAFVRVSSGGINIFLINADGSGVRQLTDNFDEHSPTWSPDGARIAFTRGSNGGANLYVMRSDGSNEIRLSNTPSVEAHPSWSTTAASRSTVLALQRAPGSNTERQVDTVYATLPHPLQVRVRRDGRPASGVTVRWTVTGGSVSQIESITDASGIASVTATLGGPAAPQFFHAEASVAGAAGSPVIFYALATEGRPARIRFDGAWAYDPERNPFTDDGRALVVPENTTLYYGVEATDRHGNALEGVLVDFAVTSGGGSVSPAVDRTKYWQGGESCWPGCEMSAVTKHTLGKDPGPQSVTATASELEGAPQVTFTAIPVSAIVVVDWDDGSDTCADFCPSNVSVATGATVGWRLWSWKNEHNVTFEDDPTQPVSSGLGHIHTRTFNAPGVYRYRCTLHSTDFTNGEVGTLTVR